MGGPRWGIGFGLVFVTRDGPQPLRQRLPRRSAPACEIAFAHLPPLLNEGAQWKKRQILIGFWLLIERLRRSTEMQKQLDCFKKPDSTKTLLGAVSAKKRSAVRERPERALKRTV